MKTTFWVTEILLRIALQAKNGDTCPQGQFFFFLNFESSAAENDVITMQPSCSQLNLSVIIALIILAACRLMVTVLSLDGVSGRKWGSHFTHSHFPRSFHLHSPVSAAKVWKWHQFLRSGAAVRGGSLRAHRHASAYDRRRFHHGATLNWTEDVRKTMTATPRRRFFFHARKRTGKEAALREEGKRRRRPSLWGNVKKSRIPAANETPLSSPRLLWCSRRVFTKTGSTKQTGLKELDNVFFSSQTIHIRRDFFVGFFVLALAGAYTASKSLLFTKQLIKH